MRKSFVNRRCRLWQASLFASLLLLVAGTALGVKPGPLRLPDPPVPAPAPVPVFVPSTLSPSHLGKNLEAPEQPRAQPRIQVLDDGVERVDVERVDIEGNAEGRVMAHIQRIVADRISNTEPLQSADLERILLLIGDLPGVSVSAVMSPGRSLDGKREGGVILTLDIEHTALTGSFAANNFMPEALEENIAGLSARAQGVLTGSDSIQFNAWHAISANAYHSASLDMSTGVGINGLRMGLSGYYSNSHPTSDALQALGYSGDSDGVALTAQYPLMRTRTRNLAIGASFKRENIGSDLRGTDFFDDRPRSLSLWSEYLWSEYDFADATEAVTSMRLTATRGLDTLGARGNSRADGVLEYTTIELDLQRSQPIAALSGGTLSLRLAAHGQTTANLDSGGLFSAAECAYGGRRFGRGFDAGVLSGDHCAFGSIEFHWTGRHPRLPPVLASSLFDYYVFFDSGAVRQKGSLRPHERRRADATAWGGGMNIQFSQRLSCLVEASRPRSLPAGLQDDDWRIRGSMIVRF